MAFDVAFLPVYGYFGGGTFGNFLSQLEQIGVFSYLLPFLIIFALIFGILTKIKIFENNKPVNAIIALSIGLMALQFGYVSTFFSELFPRLGVGLSVILAIIIAVGLFSDPDNKALNYTLLGVSVIVIIVVLSQTADVTSWWYSGWWWSDNLGNVLAIVLFLAALAIVVGGSSKSDKTFKPLIWKE